MAQLTRAYFDIVASMLQVLLEESCLKTQLASKASLDFRATQRYVSLLIKNDLAFLSQSNEVSITPKGRKFLEEYKNLRTYLEQ